MYLSGPATAAAFQTAIGQVRFCNPADQNPIPGVRTINVTVNDGEKESNIATATVTVVAIDDAPDANQRLHHHQHRRSEPAFIVPEWALLANDTDPDSMLDITAVTETSTGFTAVLGWSGVTVTDTDDNNNSFIYTATGGALSDTASVTLIPSLLNTTTYSDNFGWRRRRLHRKRWQLG